MRRIGRRVIVGAAVSVTILAVEIGWAWWEYALSTETTDNAYVHGDITAIAPKVAGYVAEVAVHDNQAVSAGDILVRNRGRGLSRTAGPGYGFGQPGPGGHREPCEA
ncbi:biotin/lipoyl-binding protein [Bradyrhizobium sp. 13971]